MTSQNGRRKKRVLFNIFFYRNLLQDSVLRTFIMKMRIRIHEIKNAYSRAWKYSKSPFFDNFTEYKYGDYSQRKYVCASLLYVKEVNLFYILIVVNKSRLLIHTIYYFWVRIHIFSVSGSKGSIKNGSDTL